MTLDRSRGLALAVLLLAAAPAAPAADVVGDIGWSRVRQGEALVDVARREGVGYHELVMANPLVDRWLPAAGTTVVLPTRFVLPRAPREGLVVNVPEMRLYQFTPRGVVTYPVAIGRDEWKTPIMETRIIERIKDPAWHPPESIRREHREQYGEILPRVVPAGPDNPLGQYALRLGTGSHLIHGTNKPYGIGMKVTHGCIRLYTEHMAALFPTVDRGAKVRLVDQPYKSGWSGGVLYVEAHPPGAGTGARLREAFLAQLRKDAGTDLQAVDWPAVHAALATPRGVPVPVAVRGGGALTAAAR